MEYEEALRVLQLSSHATPVTAEAVYWHLVGHYQGQLGRDPVAAAGIARLNGAMTVISRFLADPDQHLTTRAEKKRRRRCRVASPSDVMWTLGVSLAGAVLGLTFIALAVGPAAPGTLARLLEPQWSLALTAAMLITALAGVTAFLSRRWAAAAAAAVDYYDLLQVDPGAQVGVIAIAYEQLATKARAAGSPEARQQLRELTAAYEVLSNPERRAEYDCAYARPDQPPAAPGPPRVPPPGVAPPQPEPPPPEAKAPERSAAAPGVARWEPSVALAPFPGPVADQAAEAEPAPSQRPSWERPERPPAAPGAEAPQTLAGTPPGTSNEPSALLRLSRLLSGAVPKPPQGSGATADEDGGSPEVPALPRPTAPTAGKAARLVTLFGEGPREYIIPLHRPLVLGGDPECDVVLPATAERVAGHVVFRNGKFVFHQLSQQPLAVVDGRPARWLVLEHGDEITFPGSLRFRFELLADSSPSMAA